MVKKKPSLDMRGFYRLLKVSPEASDEEIRLAYAMAKQEAPENQLGRIEMAWSTLRDEKSRRAYDALGRQRANPLKSPWALPVAAVILVAVIGVLWLPDMRMRQKSFSAGDELVEIATGRSFGTVVRAESSHAFPNGITSAAYLVRMADGGQERWLPAIDLQATCAER